MYAEDVVVGGEHVEVGAVSGTGGGDGNLRVVDSREIAGTGGLMFFGLEREGVGVDTGEGAARVVVEGLDLVEILGTLLLEAVLTVEDELEGGHGTLLLLRPGLTGSYRSGAVTTGDNHGRTSRTGDGHGVPGSIGYREWGVGESNLGLTTALTEVPQGINLVTSDAPHQFLNGVVVGEANLLGAGGVNGVNTRMLHLFDQVFMALLRKSPPLLSIQIDVVGPHLEDTLVQVGLQSGRKIEINAHFMVLQGDQRQVETGVAVEEKHQGQVDGLGSTRGGHLPVSGLLGLIEVKLGVEPPPLLVLLVNTLTTDGEFDRGDRTLSGPLGGTTGSSGLEFNIHVTDEITVTGDSHGDTA